MKLVALCVSLALLPVVAGNAELDAFIKQQMTKGNIPGLSAVALKGDQILWHGHYGSAHPSLKNGPAVQNTTVFEFASLSKTLIGVSVMILKEKGLLSVQDDINDYLPFKITNPHFPNDKITIHGLLTHTSSIKDDAYDDIAGGQIYSEGDSAMSLAAFYKKLLSKSGAWYEKSNFWNKKPQTHFDYSNIGASLAAYIAEIVAKKANLADSYHAFVRSHVLAPLGVTNAGYLVSDFGGEAKLAPPAGAIPSAWKKRKDTFESYCFYGFPDYPDGSFKGSALDYARVFGAFINNGTYQGKQLLKPETVAYMKQHTSAPCTPLPCGGDLPQGNAFFYFETKAGRTQLGHNGGEMGIATEAFYNVDSGVGYVVLTNGDWDQTAAFGTAYDAIEAKLLSTFDGEYASASAPAMRQPRRVTKRKSHVKTSNVTTSKCPCGLPCNGVSTMFV